MKKSLIVIIFLSFTSLYANSLPLWIDYIPKNKFDILTPDTLPPSANDFVSRYLLPVKKRHSRIIGHKIDLDFILDTGTGIKEHMLKKAVKEMIDEPYFLSSRNLYIKLHLNDNSNRYNITTHPFKLFHVNGYTKKYGESKDIDITFNWIEIKSEDVVIPHTMKIKGKVTTYYSTLYKKDILVTSNNGQKLVRGEIELLRHSGIGTKENDEEKVYVIDGENEDKGFSLYSGHYILNLEEPFECNDTINENLILTPEILEEDKPIEIRVVCSYAYDAHIKGDILTEGDYGGKFYFDLRAEDVITHDEKEEDDFNTRGIAIDEENYPLDTTGNRLTLPMRKLFEEKEIYYTSWSEELIENEDSFLTNNTTGDIYKCPLQSGHFGFIRTYKDRNYFPGHTSKAGAYPSLDATFTCDMEAGGKIDLHIVVGPQVPLAVGGWDNMFNLTLGEENSNFLSESQSFTEFLNKRAPKAQSPFKMKMSFAGKFVRKEIRIYEDFNTKKDKKEDNSSNNDTFESTVLRPYIYTDTVYFDNSENEVSIEVFAEYDKVKTLDYSLYCKREKKKDKLLSEGELNFKLMAENMGLGRDSFDVNNPKECDLFRIDFDDKGRYPTSAFSPSKSLELSKEFEEE